MNSASLPEGTVIGERYRLGGKLGTGSFGVVYRARDIKSGQDVAIKLEPRKGRGSALWSEKKMYQLLEGVTGIPKLISFGKSGGYYYIVMELLGLSLEDLLNSCGRQFTLKTVLMLADEMISLLEQVHRKKVLHRDVKPENFLVGRTAGHTQLYLIDFGLSRTYWSDKCDAHIPYREDRHLVGTARYCSIYVNQGVEPSRRDDMEALGYVLIYLMRGELPWQSLKYDHASTKKQYLEKLAEKKMSTPIDKLCKNCPIEFEMYIEHCRNLHYLSCPSYQYCRRIFRELAGKMGYEYDQRFDWIVKGEGEEEKKPTG